MDVIYGIVGALAPIAIIYCFVIKKRTLGFYLLAVVLCLLLARYGCR